MVGEDIGRGAKLVATIAPPRTLRATKAAAKNSCIRGNYCS